MRVLVCPADRAGCGTYRLINPATVLRERGHEVVVAPEDHVFHVALDRDDPDKILGFSRPVGFDVVVLQRPMRAHRLSLVGALQRAGIAVVVEIDDDFDAIHPDHPAYLGAHPHWHLDLPAVPEEGLGSPVGLVRGQDPADEVVRGLRGMPRWRYDERHVADLGGHWLQACADQADLVTVSTPALAAKYGRHGRVRVLRNMVPSAYLELAA